MDLRGIEGQVAQSVYRPGYRLDDQALIRGKGNDGIFLSPPRQDRAWDPPSLLSNGYWGLLHRG